MSSVLLIWGLTIWLVKEAYERFINPEIVDSRIMLLTACLGLIFNLVMMKVLHGSHNHGHDHGGHDHHDHAHVDGHDSEPDHELHNHSHNKIEDKHNDHHSHQHADHHSH
jgi:zinc transporter 2